MTESDWLFCFDARGSLLGELSLVRQPRKLFRLGWALLSRVRHRLPTRADLIALDVTSDYADGRANVLALVEAWSAAELDGGSGIWSPEDVWCDCCWEADADEHLLPDAVHFARNPNAFAAHAAHAAARLAAGGHRVASSGPGYDAWLAEIRAQFPIYRDVVGDALAHAGPSPVRLDAHPEVGRFLQVIDAHESPDRLAYLALADALEEAGCDEPGVLKHLRAETTHYRGCWAVERAAGRETLRLRDDKALATPRARTWRRR